MKGSSEKGRRNVLSWLFALVVSFFSLPAFAALPAEVTTAFTTLETDGLAMQALVWGVLTVIVVGFWLMSIFKKGANKAK